MAWPGLTVQVQGPARHPETNRGSRKICKIAAPGEPKIARFTGGSSSAAPSRARR